MADAAQLSSLADETPEGRSIVVLAKEKYGLRGRELQPSTKPNSFPSPRRRACRGVNLNGRQIRKGAVGRHREAISHRTARRMPPEVRAAVEQIARSGGTPLVVAEKRAARWA